ncbi:hypothetical protein KBD34_01500 [Patescibacteria group bacterium]|nr:hypothetical protein [Patescibacteria group bacterium]
MSKGRQSNKQFGQERMRTAQRHVVEALSSLSVPKRCVISHEGRVVIRFEPNERVTEEKIRMVVGSANVRNVAVYLNDRCLRQPRSTTARPDKVSKSLERKILKTVKRGPCPALLAA